MKKGQNSNRRNKENYHLLMKVKPLGQLIPIVLAKRVTM